MLLLRLILLLSFTSQPSSFPSLHAYPKGSACLYLHFQNVAWFLNTCLRAIYAIYPASLYLHQCLNKEIFAEVSYLDALIYTQPHSGTYYDRRILRCTNLKTETLFLEDSLYCLLPFHQLDFVYVCIEVTVLLAIILRC